MNVADRIQNLRKQKGISQEELADRIGVSRQTVSKWESEQSTPDMDKIILLSDFFEVTTDYLLKGIEKESDNVKKTDARIFSVAGIAIGLIGIIAAVSIWNTEKNSVSVAIGLIIMTIAVMIHVVGQITGGANVKKANFAFWAADIWLIVLIPFSCVFNVAQGLLQGFTGYIAPLPQPGNSVMLYGGGWLIYIIICATFDFIWVVCNRNKR